ncbi:phosphate acetyltransferase, partial [Candidatus Peregrinibacteria bacterium]|nr:phosphate acetyltransferase [Candidatus Peregrinibacteria bacterium]
MENFLKKIKARAAENPQRIVFPEGSEPRIVEAAAIIKNEGTAIPILLGKPEEQEKFEEYVKLYSEIRGTNEAEAREEVKKPNVYATLMLKAGEVDGVITGPTSTARDRILPALQIIKSKEKFHKVSGFFFMVLPASVDKDAANGGILIFADCAINIEPDAETLADIAIDSAETAKRFGIDPKIAMLSFSTEGSTDHPLVKKVQDASALVKERRPDLQISEDMQVDAALIDSIGDIKAPGSPIAGNANILIFP